MKKKSVATLYLTHKKVSFPLEKLQKSPERFEGHFKKA
jgi:hypothetical protein